LFSFEKIDFVSPKCPAGLAAAAVRARSSIGAPGLKRIHLRDLRTAIVLDPSRLKFACGIKDGSL